MQYSNCKYKRFIEIELESAKSQARRIISGLQNPHEHRYVWHKYLSESSKVNIIKEVATQIQVAAILEPALLIQKMFRCYTIQ